MARNPQLSTLGKDAALDGIGVLLDEDGAGTLKIYGGTQPASPDVAITDQPLLVACALSTSAFAPASGGTAAANAIAPGDPVAGGTATWARLCSGAGLGVIDCTVGTSGCDITVGSTAIAVGVAVAPSSLTLTHP